MIFLLFYFLFYIHGHPLNVVVSPEPDMSILPELYIAAIYLELQDIRAKIEIVTRNNPRFNRNNRLGERAMKLTRPVYIRNRNEVPPVHELP